MSADEKKEVFISYNQQNFDQAEYFCNVLEGAGVSCWIAPRDIAPGHAWAGSVVLGITECRLVVVMLSAESLEAAEIAKEIDLANSLQKNILSVRIENTPLTGVLKYHLSTSQWVDAYLGEGNVRYSKAFGAVLLALKEGSNSFKLDSI